MHAPAHRHTPVYHCPLLVLEVSLHGDSLMLCLATHYTAGKDRAITCIFCFMLSLLPVGLQMDYHA